MEILGRLMRLAMIYFMTRKNKNLIFYLMAYKLEKSLLYMYMSDDGKQ
jgi:hypothetical protein